MKKLLPKTLHCVCLLGALTVLNGCFVDANLLRLPEESQILRNAQLAGFVSSSAQNEKTTSGYKIQSSSGSYSDKIEETTNNGYKVYISVQGNIISGP